jgi:autotransporter-associated beta strand protein
MPPGAASAYDINSGSTYQASHLGSNPTFKGGTLVLDTSTTISSNFDVQNYTTNTIDISGNAVTLSGAFTDNGPLTFTDSVGGGNVTLTSSGNAYSGTTTINSGALVSLSGSGIISSSTDVTVNGTLDISATTSGASIVALDGSGVVNLGSQNLTITNSNSNFSGVISGSGGLILTAGFQELSGTNTYTGGTTINGGTLEVGDATTNGSIIGNVADAGTLEFNRSDTVSFGGTISGKGNLTQLGVGETILTETNSYTGTTTITYGTLALSGSGSIASSSSMVANGVFDISATSGASVQSLAGSGTVQLGSETLTVTNASGTFSGVIAGDGGLTVSGGTETLTGSNTYTGPTIVTGGTLAFGESSMGYNIADSGTVAFNSTLAIAMSGVVSGTGGLAQSGNGVTTISVAQTYTGPTTISAGTLALSGNGSVSSSSGVAVTGAFDISATGGTSIVSLSGNGNVVLGQQSLTITDASGTFSGVISGSGGLTLVGGQESLTGKNNFTGPTVIAGGTLALNGPYGLSSSSGVTDEATFDISSVTSSSGLFTTIASLSGPGSVVMGSRSLTLTGAKDTFSGTMSGTGGLSITAGTEVLTGVNSYTGATSITAATLALSGGGSLASTTSVTDNGVFDISATTSSAVTIGSLSGTGTVNLGSQTLNIANGQDAFSGVMSGNGGLSISGGTETLDGADSYTGLTTISAGTLQIGPGGSVAGDIRDNGTLAFRRSDTLVYAGVISGAGSVAQTGTGTTILTGANTYAGGTVISAGVLQIGNDSTAGSIGGNVTDNGTLVFDRSDQINFGGIISGQGSVTVSNGTAIFMAASPYTGGTLIANAASLVLSSTGSIASTTITDNGMLDVSNLQAPQIASLAGGGTVVIGSQALAVTTGSSAFSGVISGSGELIITGGTQTLSGTSNYTGATTINGGTLAVSGSILTSSGVTVNSGGTLSGTGAVPSVAINGGGTIAPGMAGAGTLSVNGSVVFASNANTVVTVTSSSAGLLAVSGPQTVAGTLSIASDDGTYPIGQKLTILTAQGGISGSFALNPVQVSGAQFSSSLSYDADDVYLEINLAKLSPLLPTGSTRNQENAIGGIDRAISAQNTLPAAFESLANVSSTTLAGDADQLPSQIGAGAALAAQSLSAAFMDSIFDHTADMQPNGRPPRNQRPPGDELWGKSFAGSRVLAGDPSVGTQKSASSFFGLAGGDDWPLSANLRIGAALSAGDIDFHIANSASSGRTEAFQVAGYGLLTLGPRVYNSFASVLSLDNVSTDRLVAISGNDTLNGKFRGLLFGVRYEAGASLGWATPYLALNGDLFHAPSYHEDALSGAGTFALTYPAQSNNEMGLELGVRQRVDITIRNWTLKLSDRLAWVHDISGLPQAAEVYSELPDSKFLAYAGSRSRDGMLFSLGAAKQYRSGFGFDFHFDSRISSNEQFFTGMGGLTFAW